MADAAPVHFDPRGLLGALQRRHVSFVVIGAFARVVQGTDEITRSVDITPGTKPSTLARLELALADLHAERIDGKPLDLQTDEPVIELATDCGSLKIVPQPAGTRGYDDLRRAATYEHLGKGIRAQIASVGDLIRMGDALGREQERDLTALRQLRLISRAGAGDGPVTTESYLSAEDKARVEIDRMLDAAGWSAQDARDANLAA